LDQKLTLTLECDGVPGDAIVAAATIVEAISRPTHGTVEVLSRDDLDLEAPVGARAHLAIVVDGAAIRHFHLDVVALRFEGLERGLFRRYVLELEHELSALALRSDVRMFQDKDAKEIVTEVLDAAGVPGGDVAWSLQRPPGKRVYCVQYRESDLAFVSRLLEHEGVFYVIADDDAGTRITFADDKAAAFTSIDGDPVVPIVEGRGHGRGVFGFALETIATPERASVADYNFETPNTLLVAEQKASDEPRGDVFEYAAGHATPDEAEVLARLRCEEIVTQSRLGTGRSDRWEMRAGGTFELEGARAAHLDQKYVLTRVTHHVVAHAEQSADRPSYSNELECIPYTIPYRPARTTPRPRLRGVHAAVVTGPGGEIHTDELGRMKGKLFWDRVGADDDTSSCWMRVIQLPIGGSMALARMTWEMSILYFDGDPDRPIALSRLYNAEKTSPYGYPGATTRLALQTASSPASGKSNEIRMEDGGGGQEFFVNASKDQNAQTNNNKTEKVGVDESIDVGVDCDTTVGASQTISIGASQTSTISADENVAVAGSRTVTVGASETVTVSGNVDEAIAGSDTETTGGSATTLAAMGINKSSTGSYALTVGGSLISAAGLGVSVAVAGARSETIGGAKIVASGATVTESVAGAVAYTVGGVCVQAAAGNRDGGTSGAAALTVGGVAALNAGGKVSIKAKKVQILVGGVANFLGGGGILNLTPGSATFVGLVTLNASGSIKISGNPNLVG
jgi:type VI secretion system secreted protein VgrG